VKKTVKPICEIFHKHSQFLRKPKIIFPKMPAIFLLQSGIFSSVPNFHRHDSPAEKDLRARLSKLTLAQ